MALSLCDSKTNAQGRELVDHGTALFPVACYHDDLSVETVPWHWHDELEAGIVTEGQAVIAGGSEKYTLEQGDGFFINAGVLHAVWQVDISHCRLHSVVFHPRLVGGSIDSVFWHNYIQPLLTDLSLKSICFRHSNNWQQEAINAVENAWQSCVTEKPGYEFQTRAFLSQLIFLLTDQRPKTQDRPSEKALRDGERIKTMLQYIQEHYYEELNIGQIANSALISDSECLRCFHSTIGTTPSQYVKQFRIQKAAELLSSTNRKIVDIGTQCGFQEMSYFAKAFRDIKGCTPSEYRQRKQRTPRFASRPYVK